MTEHFTPNTEQIRVSYIGHRDSTVFYSPTVEQQRRYEAGGRAGGEFDRWLAAHDDEVRAAVQPPTREQITDVQAAVEAIARCPILSAQSGEPPEITYDVRVLTDRIKAAHAAVLALSRQPTPEQECGVCGRRYPASDARGTCPVCWPGFGEHGQQPTPSADPMAPGTTFTYPTRWEVSGRGGLTGRVIAEMVEENTTRYLDDLDPSTIRDVTLPPATPEEGDRG